MSSSTSSSESRIPALPYGRSWLLAMALAALMIGGTEAYWRARGFLPDVADTKQLWCVYRSDVYSEDGRKKMVIVGSSRAQLGVEPNALAEALPEFDVVQLAIPGTPVWGILEDLANDPEFDGIVLGSVNVTALVPPRTTDGSRDYEYVEYYHGKFVENGFYVNRAEARIKAYLQSELVALAAGHSIPEILFSKSRANAQYQYMRYDRYRPAYFYERLTADELRAVRWQRVRRIESTGPWREAESEFRRNLRRHLRPLYERLRSHGADLVLVRMPTSGEHWAHTAASAPKEKYWDAIEGATGIPTIHFKDYDDLARYDCPDTSHLDAADAPRFTRSLAEHVRAKLAAHGILE